MGKSSLSWQINRGHPWGDIIVWLRTENGWGFIPKYQDEEERREAIFNAYAEYNKQQERGTTG